MQSGRQADQAQEGSVLCLAAYFLADAPLLGGGSRWCETARWAWRDWDAHRARGPPGWSAERAFAGEWVCVSEGWLEAGSLPLRLKSGLRYIHLDSGLEDFARPCC